MSYQEQRAKEEESRATREADVSAREARFGSVAQLTDRILNPKVKELTVTNQKTEVPAWTDGKTIWLNANQLPPIGKRATKATLTTWMGANYHELGHTIYSPRKSSKLMKLIKKQEESHTDYAMIRQTENLIEDQRQERLMIKRYRYITPYLVDVALTLVLRGLNLQRGKNYKNDPTQMSLGGTWPFIAGRTWLPTELRTASLEAFPGDGKRLADLIGEYQRMGDPANGDALDALDVLVDIHDLLNDMPQYPHGPPAGCQNRKGDTQELGAGGQPKPAPDAGDETETAPSAGSDQDDATNDDEEKSEADGGSGNSSDQEGEQSDESGTGVPDDEAGDPSTDTGSGAGSDSPESMADFKDVMEKFVKDAQVEDEAYGDHIEDLAESINLDKGSAKSNLKEKGNTRQIEASAELRGVAYRLGQTFRKFVDLAMPFWEWETDSGKLNVNRWMNNTGYEYDTMFDRYEQGVLEDVSLDVTILVDVSGSMGSMVDTSGESVNHWRWRREFEEANNRWPEQADMVQAGIKSYMDLASEATWVIRKAVQRAEGDTTVIAYNTKAFLVDQTGTQPHQTRVEYMAAGGGTDPSEAILDTYQRVKNVDASNRIVIALTDGGWYGGGPVMRKMARSGVTTVGVLVAQDSDYYSTTESRTSMKARLGVDHYAQISNPMDMVALFEEVATHLLAEATAGVVR